MPRISRFGHYEGFSQQYFDGFLRTSLYLTMSDGVRLALDYFLPTRNGRLPEDPLPAIFQMTPYNRAQFVNGQLIHLLSEYSANGQTHRNNLTQLCLQGYALAVADVRGQGASFGAFTGCMTAEEGRDAAEIIAWLASQPWCSGSVGMLGSSYGASTQFLAAAERPPALKALYAAHTYFDAYDVFFPGGVRELSLPRAWGRMVDDLAGRTAPSVVAPVDGPDGTRLLEEALAEHRSRPGAAEVFEYIYREPVRDGTGYFTTRTQSGSQNLVTLLPELHRAAIPAYFHGGWNDYFPGHVAQWFVNWRTAPAKLAIGPWTHSPRTFTSPRDTEDLRIREIESLRWFDYWLKGIDNGILDEPAIHYAVQDSHRFREGEFEQERDVWHWCDSTVWPPREARATKLYLNSGRSGTVNSTNDGRLTSAAPDRSCEHVVRIDASTGTGDRNRMGSSFLGLSLLYPDMQKIDAACLTWTSDALTSPVCIVGTPQVSLPISASAPDVHVFAWLEDIDLEGRSTLISYGSLRASHRESARAPYDTVGAIYHLSTGQAVKAARSLQETGAHLACSLVPVANRFVRGHRIRLTVAGADRNNFEELAIGAELKISTGTDRLACLELPIIRAIDWPEAPPR